MPTNKKPRKAYRPKHQYLNATQVAISRASALSEAEIQQVCSGVDNAVRRLFAGEDPAFQIRVVADALNVACSFNEVGLVKVAPAIINDGLRAIKTISERGTWATKFEEREAIMTATAAHHVQMRSGMTFGEYRAAVELTKRRLAQYQAGNAPADHILVRGDLGRKAA